MLDQIFIAWMLVALQQTNQHFLNSIAMKNLRRKLAEQANISPKLFQKLIQQRLRAFLWEKLIGKQSWQKSPMRVSLQLRRHLMSMGIPRQIPIITILESPKSLTKKEKSDFFSFYPYDIILTRNGVIQHRSHHLEHFSTIHQMGINSFGNFTYVIDEIGNVWLAQNDRANPIFVPVSTKNATKCAFGFGVSNVLAIGFEDGDIEFFDFSEDLKCIRSSSSLQFVENRGLPVTDIVWAPSSSNCICAVLHECKKVTFVMMGDSDLQIIECPSDDSPKRQPVSICFSQLDPTLFVIGYDDGTVSFLKISIVERQIRFSAMVSHKIQDTPIQSIQASSTERGIFGSVRQSGDVKEVVVWKVSADFGTSEIIAVFPANIFSFNGPFLLIAYLNKISLLLIKNGRVICLIELLVTDEWNSVVTCLLDMKKSIIIFTDTEKHSQAVIELKGLSEYSLYV